MSRKAVLTIAVVVGCLLLVAAIAIRRHQIAAQQAKEAAMNAAQLALTRVEVPTQSNGFSLLVQAGEALVLTNDDREFATGKEWDEQRARQILETNAGAIALMHQAWAFPCLQVETVTNMDQEFSYLDEWSDLCRLGVLEARMTFEHGNEKQGFEQAMEVVRFGQRIQEADGTESHYTTGSDIKRWGLTRIRQFASKTTLPAGDLMAIAESLTNFEAHAYTLDQVIKVSYRGQLGSYDETFSLMGASNGSHMTFVYDGDRTRRELAAQFVSTMRAVTNCYALGMTFLPAPGGRVGFLSRMMHGNLVGEMLNDMNRDLGRNLLMAKCRENVSLQATRIVLTLKAYQAANHRLPKSLQELVPGQLPAVPLDDFDGKAMRYKPESNLVYSVGLDLIDSGGVEGTGSSDGDILFPYNFN